MTDYLTVQEVAAELRMSLSTVYRLIESGQLSHKRISTTGTRGIIRIPRQSLESFTQLSDKLFEQ